MGNGFVPSAEDVDKELEGEFRDEARDILASIELALGNARSGSGDVADILGTIKRGIQTINIQAKAVNLPLVNMVGVRLDDYLASLKDLSPEQIDDIQSYADKIAGILDGDITSVESDTGAKLVRELPMKKTFNVDFEVVIPKDVEVLVILPERSMATIVERDLAAVGLRSTNVRNPFDAFEQVVRTKPDMIISSMELGVITGIDLACSFSAMPATQNIPFALFTSYDWGHAKLEGLPPRVALLQKGPSFADDLATALARFKVL